MRIDDALGVWTTDDPALRRCPYPAYARLHRHAPIHRVTAPGASAPVWYVIGHREARQALADPRVVRDVNKLPTQNRPEDPLAALGLHRSMLAVDPPEHSRLRAIVSTAFTSRRVANLRPRIEQLASDLLDRMVQHSQVDLVEAFAFPLPVAVICELLGVPHTDQHAFRGWIRALFAPATEKAATVAADQALRDYLIDLLAAKRTTPSDDLISALVAGSHEQHRLSDAELLSTVTLLLVAGHETTVNLIACATRALADHPEQLAALRTHPHLLIGAIEELLRYDGPTQMAVARWARQDLTLGGVTIPAGGTIMIVLGAANHDPHQFTDPERLDIRRPASGHLAFGHGTHYCLGAPLARLETQIALRSLVQRFPDLRLAVPADQLQAAPNAALRAFTALPVTLTRTQA